MHSYALYLQLATCLKLFGVVPVRAVAVGVKAVAVGVKAGVG